MNTQTRELLRINLLRTCASCASVGAGIDLLVTGARTQGFTKADEEVVGDELQYLLDKQFVTRVEKAISPENRRWRATAEGRDELAQHGF